MTGISAPGKALTRATLFGLAVALAAGATSRAQGPGLEPPDFPPGATWVNVPQPLTLRGLRGKVVLLDFWTYGCINCLHVLPDIRRLEEKYPAELVVIGVHTAKFPNEDNPASLARAVARYGIRHPVVNDSGRRYWNALGIQAWPTQVLIDAHGRYVGKVAGEGHAADIARTVDRLVRQGREGGRLDPRPLPLALASAGSRPDGLSFPGKVLADLGPGSTERIYIADTEHHRIIVARADGTVDAVAGTGRRGKADGGFHEAAFSTPHGLALRRGSDGSEQIFVADTGNHLIRMLDLRRGRVTTVAGTGRQATVTRRSLGGAGVRTALASPWDLLSAGSSLFVAMAGLHQVWVMNPSTGQIRPYAGSGLEARRDGSLLLSAFAQPSGLATDGKLLFVADSESSSIRAVDLPGGAARVRSLTAGDLFDFGDRDGFGPAVRLQHPLGLAYGDGLLYIADSYNHKLKRMDVRTGRVESLPIGIAGPAGSRPGFHEPGGLSLAGNGPQRDLYVADTNQHRIVVVDAASLRARVLTLKNLPRALPGEVDEPDEPEAPRLLPAVQLAPGASGAVTLRLTLPPGHRLAEGAGHQVRLETEGEGLTLDPARPALAGPNPEAKLGYRTTAAGRGALLVTLSLFLCSEREAVCKLRTLRLRVPYSVSPEGSAGVEVGVEVP